MNKPDDLRASIEAAKVLRQQIANVLVEGDLVALQDTFDGETTLDVELRNAVLAEDEDKIIIDGIKQRIAELTERLRRAERRIEFRRGLMEQAMVIAGWFNHKMDIATISLGKAKPRLEIDNESDIPTQFFKVPPPPDPVLDKAGLMATLTERHKKISETDNIIDDVQRQARLASIDAEYHQIPGCHLETGGHTLTIRRK